MYIEMSISGKRPSYSIADARSHLAGLIREAEERGPVELTRRGKPVAVLVGTRVWQELAGAEAAFSSAWQAFRREVDLAALGIDPDAVFGDARSESRGREVDL